MPATLAKHILLLSAEPATSTHATLGALHIFPTAPNIIITYTFIIFMTISTHTDTCAPRLESRQPAKRHRPNQRVVFIWWGDAFISSARAQETLTFSKLNLSKPSARGHRNRSCRASRQLQMHVSILCKCNGDARPLPRIAYGDLIWMILQCGWVKFRLLADLIAHWIEHVLKMCHTCNLYNYRFRFKA